MYIETSQETSVNGIFFLSFERKDIIPISNTSFSYNRSSFLTRDNLNPMGHYIFQLLLEDSTWSTRYNIPKIDRYSNSSTDWTLVSLNFNVENYGNKMIYDQIDTPHDDISFFSN